MNHASIIDGCRLSFGRTIKFKHNDIEDLARVLDSVEMEESNGSVLVITEGVFSMEGDLGILPQITRLKKRYGANGFVHLGQGKWYPGEQLPRIC